MNFQNQSSKSNEITLTIDKKGVSNYIINYSNRKTIFYHNGLSCHLRTAILIDQFFACIFSCMRIFNVASYNFTEEKNDAN